jgi:ADP-ribose/FAD diphosphatase
VPVRRDVPEHMLADEVRLASLHALKCRFCKRCGGAMELAVPTNEDALRHVCIKCAYVDYHNPKMVVGMVVEHEGRVLLCKRALEPCAGLWTLPAGYMELGESCAEGAARETMEEANAAVEIASPYAHLDIPVIGQAYIFFRGRLAAPYTYSAGPESEDVRLFAPDDIPYDQLAFSSVLLTLKRWEADIRRGAYTLAHGVIRKKPGASYRDPDAFQYKESYEVTLMQDVIEKG